MYYEATYVPLTNKKLPATAQKNIGKKIALLEGGKMLKGPHRGKPSYIPCNHFGIIPICDLKGVSNIPKRKWDEISKSMETY